MNNKDPWDTFGASNGNHVIPRHDDRPHDPLPHCWCSPMLIMPEKLGGAVIYVHHPADGRAEYDRRS